MRLVARRTLWDGGTQVQAVSSLAALHPEARVIVHPSVLAGLGTAEGERVRVVSGRGSLVLPAVGDFAIAKGTALLRWNLPAANAGDLIDSALPYTEVRFETVAPEGGDAHG
jgi:assimilatory nitrate reductase catalytic subunit